MINTLLKILLASIGIAGGGLLAMMATQNAEPLMILLGSLLGLVLCLGAAFTAETLLKR